MLETKEIQSSKIQTSEVQVFKLADSFAIAAETLEDAYSLLKELLGFEQEIIYSADNVEIIPHDYEVQLSDLDSEYVSVAEILNRGWHGKPFIVFYIF